MTLFGSVPEADTNELPTAPRKGPVAILRKIYNFLSSAKLAMFLLVAILASCIVGVTIFRGRQAWEIIFGTLWFNGLMILLVLNVGFCFFSKIWGRKLTLISLGMVLFHLSFVSMFAGIIYNSLFYFRGAIRLTEGETLPSGELQSYDYTEQGRFFDVSRLRGETTLIKMYTGYKINGADKKVAYEIAVGEGSLKKRGIVYITHNLDHEGFSYFRDKEGYSILVVLHDKLGREPYGVFVPLQSLKQKGDQYLYTTGTASSPGSFPFPPDIEKAIFDIQIAYHPAFLKERSGEASYQIRSLAKGGEIKPEGEPVIAEGRTAIGNKFKVGDRYLSVEEVRYWVAMSVRYEPGKPIVLTSLWVGLSGMIITFIGRMRRGSA